MYSCYASWESASGGIWPVLSCKTLCIPPANGGLWGGVVLLFLWHDRVGLHLGRMKSVLQAFLPCALTTVCTSRVSSMVRFLPFLPGTPRLRRCRAFSNLLLVRVFSVELREFYPFFSPRLGQFVDHITGKHVGFPESELTTLFEFFRSPMAPGSAGADASPSKKPSDFPQKRYGASISPTSQTALKNTVYGADWVLALASLRLLARPKEPAMAAALGVFGVFARARGYRARHRHRLEQERAEKEMQRQLEEERERWKRRRRREQEMGTAPSAEVRNRRCK